MNLKKKTTIKLKKDILRFFSYQRIDVADKNCEYLYNGDLSEIHKFSLLIDNPKGKRGSFFGVSYLRKPMLVAYFSFLSDEKWVLQINGKENMDWGKKQKKMLERKYKEIQISLLSISDKAIFQKKKYSFSTFRDVNSR